MKEFKMNENINALANLGFHFSISLFYLLTVISFNWLGKLSSELIKKEIITLNFSDPLLTSVFISFCDFGQFCY